MKLSQLAIAFASLLPLAAPGRAVTIVSAERAVLVSTFYDVSPLGFDSDVDGAGSTTTDPFLEAAVSSIGRGSSANAAAEAAQTSRVQLAGGASLSADGGGATGVAFDVADPGRASRAEGTADSALRIAFSVDAPAAWSFALALDAELAELSIVSGAGPADASFVAYARLVGATTGTLVDVRIEDRAADGVALAHVESFGGTLAPDTYVLELGASGLAGGFEDAFGFGTAGFGFDFLVVREPGAAMLFGIGLGGLLLFSRARRL